MFRYALILGIVGILAATPLWAQPKAAADGKPAAEKAGAKAADAPKGDPLKATVESVSGIAEKRSASDAKGKWTPVKVGDVLNEFALIRTGFGAKVVLKFSDRSKITVRTSTKIGIGLFRKQGDLVKVRLGLKYGAINAKVDSAKGANDVMIRTAAGTMAAKGSEQDIAQWGDFSLQSQVIEGGWQTRIANKVATVYAGEFVNKNLEVPSIDVKLDQSITKVYDTHDTGTATAEIKTIVRHPGIVGFTGTTNNRPTPRLVEDTPLPVPILPVPTGPTDDQLHGPTGGFTDPEYTYPR